MTSRRVHFSDCATVVSYDPKKKTAPDTPWIRKSVDPFADPLRGFLWRFIHSCPLVIKKYEIRSTNLDGQVWRYAVHPTEDVKCPSCRKHTGWHVRPDDILETILLSSEFTCSCGNEFSVVRSVLVLRSAPNWLSSHAETWQPHLERLYHSHKRSQELVKKFLNSRAEVFAGRRKTLVPFAELYGRFSRLRGDSEVVQRRLRVRGDSEVLPHDVYRDPRYLSLYFALFQYTLEFVEEETENTTLSKSLLCLCEALSDRRNQDVPALVRAAAAASRGFGRFFDCYFFLFFKMMHFS